MESKDQVVIVKLLTDMHGKIKKINDDIAEIKKDIQGLKIENDKILNAFPHGTDQHRSEHQRKKIFGIF